MDGRCRSLPISWLLVLFLASPRNPRTTKPIQTAFWRCHLSLLSQNRQHMAQISPLLHYQPLFDRSINWQETIPMNLCHNLSYKFMDHVRFLHLLISPLLAVLHPPIGSSAPIYHTKSSIKLQTHQIVELFMLREIPRTLLCTIGIWPTQWKWPKETHGH